MMARSGSIGAGSQRWSAAIILVASTIAAAVAAGCASSAGSSGSSVSAPVAGIRPEPGTASDGAQTEYSSGTVTPAEPTPRALLVGDSTLLAVERYRVQSTFRGFDYVYSAESCRTLGIPSCGDPPIPPNALDTILAADGTFDFVVIMAGYDEWWTSFPASFDLVVQAARSKGAQHIVWLTYREGVGYIAPDGASANEAFVRNNQTLRAKLASGDYPDLVLADWYSYSAPTAGWLSDDGIHLTKSGGRGVADYISRWIAFLGGLPCPMPWAPGEPIDTVCPNPDLHGPVTDIAALYS